MLRTNLETQQMWHRPQQVTKPHFHPKQVQVLLKLHDAQLGFWPLFSEEFQLQNQILQEWKTAGIETMAREWKTAGGRNLPRWEKIRHVENVG